MREGDTIIGKRILVGLTYMTEDGAIRGQVQFHGLITAVSDSTIVLDRADGSGEFSIPFERELDAADPEATYTLSCSGEEVTGVDILASWTIHPSDTR